VPAVSAAMVGADELAELEGRVERALRAGDDEGLDVLGYGEISLVLGWPPGRREFACKRLPPFPEADRFATYAETVHRYVEVLRAHDVDVVDTAVEYLDVPRGVVGYVVQPVVPASSLLPAVLRATAPGAGHPAVEAIVDAVVRVVGSEVGLDAQVSNWAWVGDHLRYFDVTTPFLRSGDRTDALDVDLLLASLPWALRPPVRRFVVQGVLDRFHDPRSVLVDLCGNLLKERLDRWLPVALEAVNARVADPVSESEVRRFYTGDARLWEAMLRVRRADRWWQRRVRRRVYPFLLPGPIER